MHLCVFAHVELNTQECKGLMRANKQQVRLLTYHGDRVRRTGSTDHIGKVWAMEKQNRTYIEYTE